ARPGGGSAKAPQARSGPTHGGRGGAGRRWPGTRRQRTGRRPQDQASRTYRTWGGHSSPGRPRPPVTKATGSETVCLSGATTPPPRATAGRRATFTDRRRCGRGAFLLRAEGPYPGDALLVHRHHHPEAERRVGVLHVVVVSEAGALLARGDVPELHRGVGLTVRRQGLAVGQRPHPLDRPRMCLDDGPDLLRLQVVQDDRFVLAP